MSGTLVDDVRAIATFLEEGFQATETDVRRVRSAADEIDRLTRERDGWESAFYREECRAVEYHNLDSLCGHPASCIRNGDRGAACLMCEQQTTIDRLTRELDEARAVVNRMAELSLMKDNPRFWLAAALLCDQAAEQVRQPCNP